MNYVDYRRMEKTHVCAMCGGELVTIWDDENTCYRLCCGPDHTHNGFQARLSPQKALQRGQADAVIQPGAQKDLEERAKRNETALSLLPKSDIATGQALGIAKIGELVVWAESLGLNAQLGHVCLYHGKPYVTIDGYYYLNNKRKKPYIIGTKPMDDVQMEAYALEQGSYGYLANAYIVGKILETVGIGIVTKDEGEAKSARDPGQFRAPVVHSHPQRMAEKRAEWQLLRKLIPLEVKDD